MRDRESYGIASETAQPPDFEGLPLQLILVLRTRNAPLHRITSLCISITLVLRRWLQPPPKRPWVEFSLFDLAQENCARGAHRDALVGAAGGLGGMPARMSCAPTTSCMAQGSRRPSRVEQSPRADRSTSTPVIEKRWLAGYLRGDAGKPQRHARRHSRNLKSTRGGQRCHPRRHGPDFDRGGVLCALQVPLTPQDLIALRARRPQQVCGSSYSATGRARRARHVLLA